MSEITKIAEKAADEIYGCVDTDGFGGIMFDRAKIAKIIEEAARAAIDAYEAAKREEITVAFPAEMTEEQRADLEFSRGEQWSQDLPQESANVEPAKHDIVRISGGYIGFKP